MFYNQTMNCGEEKKECRFIVVDDDVHVLFFVERALMAAFPGASITTFTDGREALEYIRRAGADMVITDHSMRFMNGAELIRELRQAGSDLPIIMISNSPHAEEQGQAAGATVFLEKGQAPTRLTDTVRTLMVNHPCSPT
jgi:CheY-like chemotaxis protein